MKRPRFINTSMMAIAAAVALLCTGAYAVPVVDPNGHMLSVEVVYDPGDPSVQGLAVVDQGPSSTVTSTVMSTFDTVIDSYPDIALDPYDGTQVLVWSRLIGGDYELAMTHQTSSGWGPIDILTGNGTQDISPRAQVDITGLAHILWYPSGIGGPVFLQSFHTNNGHAAGPVARPLEPVSTRTLKTGTTGGSDVGGGDDPGLIGGLTSKASENPCVANPAAAPDHGVVMACGRPAAYQLSGCQLVVGVYDNIRGTWGQTVSDLSWRSLSGTSPRAIAQGIANARCN